MNGPFLCTGDQSRATADIINLAFAAGTAFAVFFTPALKVLHDFINPLLVDIDTSHAGERSGELVSIR